MEDFLWHLSYFLFIVLFLFIFTFSILSIELKLPSAYEYKDFNNNLYNSNSCYSKIFGSSMYCIDSDGFKIEVSSYKVSSYENKSILELFFSS